MSVEVNIHPFNLCLSLRISVSDFPARTFIQHLLELTVLRTEKHIHVASSQTKQDIPIIDIEAASELFENAVELYRTQLNLVLNVSIRRSPKRRGMSEESVSYVYICIVFDYIEDRAHDINVVKATQTTD